MASFIKLPSGNWRAQVHRRGKRMTGTFPNKTAARDWAVRQEYLLGSDQAAIPSGTVADLFDRYAQEVSPKKRGERWEQIRLNLLKGYPIGRVDLVDLGPSHVVDFREQRLREVSPASVRREMVLMSAVFTTAVDEWELLARHPMKKVSKPAGSGRRTRRVSAAEIDRLIAVASGPKRWTVQARAVHAFRFACVTGMRAGEICSLTADRIGDRDCFLPKTKNGQSRRVPLIAEARDLLAELPPVSDGAVFRLTTRQLDASFRQVRDAAGIDDLRFHDSRHEALSRFAKHIEPPALARMFGWTNLQELMTYYDEPASDVADRLDQSIAESK